VPSLHFEPKQMVRAESRNTCTARNRH